jgi:hypothetical protein
MTNSRLLLSAALSLTPLLCSCAPTLHPTSNATTLSPALPRTQRINPDAGGHGLIVLTLRLADGQKLPFVLDTGCPVTAIDRSLAPRLGKCLATGTVNLLDTGGKPESSSAYAAPPLYLSHTRLPTGDGVCTYDFQSLSSRLDTPIMGILGMDCLRHYCLQLDFSSHKLRFLTPDQLDPRQLGAAIPMTFAPDGCPLINTSLLSKENITYEIDTGNNNDVVIDPELFQHVLHDHPGTSVHHTTGGNAQDLAGYITLPTVAWAGRTYTDVDVNQSPDHWVNTLGLRLLSRHLVTLDFPNHTLYLKQTRADHIPVHSKPLELLITLLHKGRLPGFPKGTDWTCHCTAYQPDSRTYEFEAHGNPSVFHYTVSRTSQTAPWSLQKAWRTDKGNHTIEEFDPSAHRNDSP